MNTDPNIDRNDDLLTGNPGTPPVGAGVGTADGAVAGGRVRPTTNALDTDPEGDRNEDPITGEPGAHPVGVGVGTAGGAATGAAIGAVGGPVGAVVGAIVGGVAGAYAGKGVAEQIDPTVEDAYWRKNHDSQEWASNETTYDDDFEPAYRMGYENRAAHTDAKWEDKESELGNDWDRFKGNSRLKWDQAKSATRAGWHRVEDRLPGDADNDGH